MASENCTAFGSVRYVPRELLHEPTWLWATLYTGSQGICLRSATNFPNFYRLSISITNFRRSKFCDLHTFIYFILHYFIFLSCEFERGIRTYSEVHTIDFWSKFVQYLQIVAHKIYFMNNDYLLPHIFFSLKILKIHICNIVPLLSNRDEIFNHISHY